MDAAAAIAKFARAQAKTYTDLADDLEDSSSEPALVVAEHLPEPTDEHALGSRQKQIVALLGLRSEAGLRTSEIASAIDYEVPNTYSTLQALARQNVVEQVPNKEPQHWRLARRYRPTFDAFLEVAGRVERGEWTTYGDISIAVFGHPRAAQVVGRALSTTDTFKYAQRVLDKGGVVSPKWRDSQGRGPEECRRRLAADGVRFLDDGRADPAQHVTWDELQSRGADKS